MSDDVQTAAAKRRMPSDFGILARCRLAQMRNLIDQQLREAPWRTLAIVGLLILIWAAFWFLLRLVLQHVRSWGLIGVVADQHLFVHFFVVLAIMLAFSNAVLMFGALYGRHEAAALLAMPVRTRAVVLVKWIEGVFLSSWSFLLLGVPLMLAATSTGGGGGQWYYYPLFLAHFVSFVAIPACLGLLAAWAVAMFAPHRPLGIAIGASAIIVLLAVYWLSTLSERAGVSDPDRWLRGLLRQVGSAKDWFPPSTWTARGIVAALQQRVAESLFYLMVVLGNAAFLAWVTINVLGSTWSEAYNRAQQGRVHPRIRRGWITEALTFLLFFYLPARLRKIMLKDVREFGRDAKQWSQMAIMLGLLAIYVLNLTRLPFDLGHEYTRGMIAFLNLTTISLILATFTSRFVHPLLSLESQQLWLLELLPVRRTTLLLVKFLFALTVSVLSAGGVLLLSVQVLGLPRLWALVNLSICLGICVGLSGLSIGLGARFPVLGQRNPARIAAGFGGTLNLIASMAFVGVQMAGAAWLSARTLADVGGFAFGLPDSLSPEGWRVLFGLLLLSAAVAGTALFCGARHFNRLET